MSKDPGKFLYVYLSRVSGPQSASGLDVDMNVNGSVATPGVFEYEVVDTHVDLSRFTINLLDGGESPQEFAGISALTDGCLVQIVDTDGSTVLQHFSTDVVPLVKNADFNMLAGVDVTHQIDPGDDLLSVRFTVAKAGAPMRLKEGQRIRVIIQDDLRNVTEFRWQAQLTIATS